MKKGLLNQHALKFRNRHRRAVIKPLYEITAVCPQEINVFLRFYPLSDGLHTQSVQNRQQLSQYNLLLFIQRLIEKAAVQLNRRNRQGAEQTE